MTLPARLSILILAVAAALPLTVSTAAHAQAAAGVTAERFAVEPVRALVPGTELNFQLAATPGAAVTRQIAGASGSLRLDETRAGLYEGTWTVRSRDRLTAASLVTAHVAKDGRSFVATLDQSLQRGAPSPVQAPRIGAFPVNAPERMGPAACAWADAAVGERGNGPPRPARPPFAWGSRRLVSYNPGTRPLR